MKTKAGSKGSRHTPSPKTAATSRAAAAIAVGAFDAKTHLSALLDRVAEGQTFVITKHGKPVAELKPIPSSKKLELGWLKGRDFFMAADFDAPLEDFKEYET